ncbi:methyltransferase [Anaeroselena agilis]|uniref:Methyltransferase n=1 Tax=Anaeroselena agilis TaxID=3063788 RepID=A0ABU3NVB3_9FIRM|nr:methyltransferase [Selenomonadales bacterium 4137-cl]
MQRSQTLYQPLEVDPAPLTALSLNRQIYEAVCVALKLGLFKHLQSARTPGEVAGALNLNQDVAHYLLKLLVHADCIAESGGRFAATPLANAYLREDSPLYLGHEFSLDCEYGAKLLTVLSPQSPKATPEPEWTKERLRQIGVFGLMGSIQSTVEAVDLGAARRLLDLGGGHGFYSIAFAQKYPQLEITLFDLPHVAAYAETFIREYALERRISTRGGDFLTDNIGESYDAVLCANVLHSTKRDFLLAKIRQALNPGGQIIVKTRIGDVADNLENAATKLLWQIKGGKELFTFAEWRHFLAAHGFREARLAGLSGIYATITAQTGGTDGHR